MVDTLNEQNLAKMFTDRFLNKHYPMLNAISYILTNQYGEDNFSNNLLEDIYSKGNISQTLNDPDTETRNMRSLRNAWYHECSLNYPFEYTERMKFPAWKIIQCYYAVFSSIAALVRTFDDRTRGHDSLLNSYGTLFLRNRERKRFFVIPLCIHLKQDGKLGDSYYELLPWEYGKKHNLPKIIKRLEKTKVENKLRGIVTIPHYLKSLRDWATYEDPYIFFRLYGPKIREGLDSYLRIICKAHLSQTEAVMVKLYGFDAINLQKDVFSKNLTKYMEIEPNELIERFEVHKGLANH